MNAPELLKIYDNGQLSRDEITDILGRTCSTDYLAGAYIEARAQRDKCREQAHANRAEATITNHTDDLSFAAIIAALDAEEITRDEASDALVNLHTPVSVAWNYLAVRAQRNELQKKANADNPMPAAPTLQWDTTMDLIGHAYSAGAIGWTKAHGYLTTILLSPATANTYLKELDELNDPTTIRETYLADPANAILFCTRCGIKVDANLLSTNSLCIECSSAAVEQNLIELEAKEGPYYQHWRESMLDYAFKLAREVLDDIVAKEASTEGDMLDYDKKPDCDEDCDDCDDPNCAYRCPITPAFDDDVPF